MSTQRPIYRKAALDKLASPEELDQLMHLTRPAIWLLMAAFGGVLLAVMLWGVFGEITTTIEQPGILTLSQPVLFVTAPEAARVLEIAVEPGEEVTNGQLIARIVTQTDTIAVPSPVTGQVLAIRARPGSPVDEGTPLVSIESYDGETTQQEIVAYISLEARQDIQTGMRVQVLPATVEREKYGYLRGRVSSVAAFAASTEEMLAVLGDASAVDELAANAPVFELRIQLDTDDDGAFVWSASDGPETLLVTGTPCLLTIQVDKERPISRVFNLGS